MTPVVQTSKDWWMPRHEQILELVAQGRVDMIFIGDSITHGWSKAVWGQYYEPRNAVNLGFGGDRTEHVLWRLTHGEIDGISPKLAVVMIGTNNSGRNSAEETADGIKAICALLRTKLPETKVLILAIFPRGDAEQSSDKTHGATMNPIWAKNNEVNRLISGIADNQMVYFLDINQAFLNEDGVLEREIMPDLLHPKEKGYKIWAEAMKPTIKVLMNE